MPLSFAFHEPLWLLLLPAALPFFWWVQRTWPTPLSPFRRWTALGLRGLGLLLLVLALAGFTLMRSHDELAVVFLVDGSDSVPGGSRNDALAFAREATRGMRPGDRAGIVVFGRDARVEAAPTPGLEVPEKTASVVDASATDLAAAVRVAAGVFPADARKRIVVLSDGLENRGDLEEESIAAAAQGIELDYLPLGRREGPEVLVERVQSPPRVAQDQAFDVQVVVRPFDDTGATVRLFRDGTLVDQRRLALEAGKPRVVVFPQRLQEGGFFAFEAVVEPDKDTIAQNNAAIGYTRVSGTPRVLIASAARSGGRYLRAALEEGGFEVRVGGIETLGTNLADLAAYDAILLENVPATNLTRAQMETLRSYVRDFGGGLIAIGGDQAFGVGGWDETPLEETMPVDMTLKETEQHPAVCLEIVIDKSGSMEGVIGGVSKIQMAKEAAIAAVTLLSPRDSVGVIAFDDASQVLLPVTKLTQKGRVVEAIASMGGGGGTNFFPALEDGLTEASRSGAAVKHVLLLSDGQSSPGDIAGLTAKYRAAGVTLSSIAIGPDADQHTMKTIAEGGGGRYYFSPDAESIPRIFSRETILVARNYIIEEPFTPALRAGGGMLRGFESVAIPALTGYVGTTRKDQATVWLETHKGDPLLASWRLGLGKAIAFTSDAEPRWSKGWVDWEGYPKFWTQVVRYSLGVRESPGLVATATVDREGVLRIEAEATDPRGEFANFRDVRAEVVGPDRQTRSVTLRQTGPGRYAALTHADKPGAYLVTVAMVSPAANAGQEELAARAVAGASVSYSPEYRVSAGDGGLLARVSDRTGGMALAAPDRVFRPPEIPIRVPKPVTASLLWIAAVLFLLDVAVRRVMLGREGVEKIAAWFRARFDPAPVPATTHLGGLAAAKRSAAPAASPLPSKEVAARRPAEAGPRTPPAERIPDRPVIRPQAPPRTNPDAPPPASPPPDPPPAQGGNLAGSLLDRVKKKR